MSSIFKKRACEVIDLKENGTFSAGQNVDALGWGKVVAHAFQHLAVHGVPPTVILLGTNHR